MNQNELFEELNEIDTKLYHIVEKMKGKTIYIPRSKFDNNVITNMMLLITHLLQQIEEDRRL